MNVSISYCKHYETTGCNRNEYVWIRSGDMCAKAAGQRDLGTNPGVIAGWRTTSKELSRGTQKCLLYTNKCGRQRRRYGSYGTIPRHYSLCMRISVATVFATYKQIVVLVFEYYYCYFILSVRVVCRRHLYALLILIIINPRLAVV